MRLFTWMYFVCYVHTWCPRMPEEGIRSFRTGVTNSCEPPCVCLQGQQIHSLHPQPLYSTALYLSISKFLHSMPKKITIVPKSLPGCLWEAAAL